MPEVKSYANQGLLEDVKSKLIEGETKLVEGETKPGRKPRVLVIGALGRCGSSAVYLCKQAGIPDQNIPKWDLPKTKKGGPIEEIAESDIFVNCIYFSVEIPPFINKESLSSEKRKRFVICDVSTDTSNLTI